MTTKLRSDAWEAGLSEETRRELYRLTKAPTDEERKENRPWLRDFGRDVLPYLSLHGIVAPGRTAWYNFLGRMREDEAAQTVIGLETSKRIARGIQAVQIDQRLAADMMTSLAVDEAAKPCEARNEKAMQIFANAAALFAGAAQREEELKLKGRAQETKDEQLRLAREKFEAAERRLERVAEIADAARGGKVDPAKVADEIDRILGRKK